MFEVGLVHGTRIRACGRQIVKEALVELGDLVAARATCGPQVRQRIARTVIEEQILRRQQPKLTQETGVEQWGAIHALEQRVVVPQSRELRRAVDIDLTQPSQVVEAEIVEEASVVRQVEDARDIGKELGW